MTSSLTMYSRLVLLPQVKKASSYHLSIRDADAKRLDLTSYPGEALAGTIRVCFCSLVVLMEKIFQHAERTRR